MSDVFTRDQVKEAIMSLGVGGGVSAEFVDDFEIIDLGDYDIDLAVSLKWDDIAETVLDALTPPPDPACADAEGGERGERRTRRGR